MKQSGLFLDLASWPNWAMAKWPNSGFSVKIHETMTGIYTQIHPNNSQTMKKKDSLVWWTSIPYSCLRESKHRLSPASQRWSMVTAASYSGGVFQRQGLGKRSEKTESWMQLNTEISFMKTWFRALRTSDWAESSPSSITITLRTQPRQCRSGLGMTLWTSLSGPARAGTWSQSDIFGETCKWLSTDGPQPTCQSLRWSKVKNGQKKKNADVQNLLHPGQKDLRL